MTLPMGLPGYYNDHQTAWKGIIGFKAPLLPVGVEAEYIDFGQPDHHHGHYDVNYYGEDSHPRAGALFAVGLPAHSAAVHRHLWQGGGGAPEDHGQHRGAQLRLPRRRTARECLLRCIATIRTDTKFAYGAGVQSRFLFGLAVRAEYERISSSYGDPDAFTVSATWTF